MGEDDKMGAWERAGMNVGVFVAVLFTGLLYGALAIMLIGMGGWPWLLWTLFGVKVGSVILSALKARKSLIAESAR